MGEDLSCDGGPLANSAHDPRWGRIAETYGEDPMHIQTMGVRPGQEKAALNGHHVFWAPLLTHFSGSDATPRVPCAVCRALQGAHGHLMLIGACDPFSCPIWGIRLVRWSGCRTRSPCPAASLRTSSSRPGRSPVTISGTTAQARISARPRATNSAVATLSQPTAASLIRIFQPTVCYIAEGVCLLCQLVLCVVPFATPFILRCTKGSC